MVAALQRLALAAAFGDRAGAMQADIVEPAKSGAVMHHHDRFVANVSRDERTSLGQVAGAPHQRPGAAKDLVGFEGGVDRIDIEPRWNGRGTADVGVEREDQRHTGMPESRAARFIRTRAASFP
jgi:hypothetical protein